MTEWHLWHLTLLLALVQRSKSATVSYDSTGTVHSLYHSTCLRHSNVTILPRRPLKRQAESSASMLRQMHPSALDTDVSMGHSITKELLILFWN